MPRSKKAKKSTKPTPDPRGVAALIVARQFDSDGSNTTHTLFSNDVFLKVQNSVKAREKADGYYAEDNDEMNAREAGYLVGVQVGLRLRSVGVCPADYFAGAYRRAGRA